MDKTLYEFPVTIYGNLEKYNEVLSKARCRIFYKYENRNGTYITDEFANKLLSSLPYAPVKGIYSLEGSDYEDHGASRDEGRIYGIVPENPNVSWETHMDKDGVERSYACTDVLIFTALYEEAADIVGKSQSMELYAPSLKYHEAMIQNKRYIVFDEGCFLGLQVLGNDVEPCFEGASFYTLQNTIETIINQLKNYGGTNMPKVNFKLSDDEKDMIELGEMVKCYIVDVTEQEKSTLETLRALNGGTYELVSDVLTDAQKNFEQVSEFSTKIEELNETIATLSSEKADIEAQASEYSAQIETVNNTLTSLNEELDSLKQYKLSIETLQKNSVIDEYSEQLSEDILSKYRENIEQYGVEELDKELAYELKKNNSSAFAKTSKNDGFVPKDVPVDGLVAILSKYKK